MFYSTVLPSILPNNTWFIMKSITTSQKGSILSLASRALSTRDVASKTSLSKSTYAKVLKLSAPHRQTPRAGRPSKLSDVHKRAIIRKVTAGYAENASQSTPAINYSLATFVSTQTVRNVLRNAGLKAVTKVKKPKLSAAHQKTPIRLRALKLVS